MIGGKIFYDRECHIQPGLALAALILEIKHSTKANTVDWIACTTSAMVSPSFADRQGNQMHCNL